MAKVLCVLYLDPETGYPPQYARDSIPTIAGYANGQTAPTPNGFGFKPGELVGSVSGELGLRSYLKKLGHELVVTSDKDGENSEFEKHLSDAIFSAWPMRRNPRLSVSREPMPSAIASAY
jgi:formate dehydrogenase